MSTLSANPETSRPCHRLPRCLAGRFPAACSPSWTCQPSWRHRRQRVPPPAENSLVCSSRAFGASPVSRRWVDRRWVMVGGSSVGEVRNIFCAQHTSTTTSLWRATNKTSTSKALRAAKHTGTTVRSRAGINAAEETALRTASIVPKYWRVHPGLRLPN